MDRMHDDGRDLAPDARPANAREPDAARRPDAARDDEPSAGEYVGEAVGGVSGALAGAALGSLGGPVGLLIGGIAGAAGGWWTGKAVADAAGEFEREDDEYFRRAYETHPARRDDLEYERVRPAFQLGWLAGYNPDFMALAWSDVEPQLERGWTADLRERYGDWPVVRDFAREGFERCRTRPRTTRHEGRIASEPPSERRE